MKYRHSFHAGNFADVHKHVALLALLAALRRKEKGFLYLETHAGRGVYEVGRRSGDAQAESKSGVERFMRGTHRADELREYAQLVTAYRNRARNSNLYPGSPVLAAERLRSQDRAVFFEWLPEEARALERAFERAASESAGPPSARIRVEAGDGFEGLRAHLPPPERRGLLLIDPPYEESRQDFARAAGALEESLRRFRTGVVALWYPIKDARDTQAWLASLSRRLGCEMLVSELWLHPPDSRVALNGSGLLILNPPYLIAERMREWLPELQACLGIDGHGGSDVRVLNADAG